MAAKASSAPFSTLPAGYLLSGRYSIQRSLGQGGFGITYLAYDTKLEIEVCVKELFVKGSTVRMDGERLASQDLEVGVFDGWRRRFLSEARSLARYDHANIVRVMDLFEGNGTAYMVMEYVRGMSLKQRLSAGGSMAEVDALAIMGSLLDAVELVHASGQLHRDIKPDNVLLTDSGRVVLIDFGAARDFSEGGSDTHSVQLTPGYAPPEQYSTRARRGPFTDVYALGATMYFLLTGEKPLAATDRHLEELPSPRSLNGEVSEGVSEAVMRALALRPEDRYATVEALRKGLAVAPAPTSPAAPTGAPGSEPDPGEAPVSAPPRAGRRLAWVGGLLLLVLLGWGVKLLRSDRSSADGVDAGALVEDSVAVPVDEGERAEVPPSPPVEMQEEEETQVPEDSDPPAPQSTQPPRSQPQPTPTPVVSTPPAKASSGTVLDIEGNVYKTVTIGSQEWMAENLRTSKYRNGDAIPGNLSNDEWKSATSGAQAVYDNKNSNLSTYGRLYNWYAVKDTRGLCPSGWRVPTDAEWTELTNFLGGLEVAGKKMKTSNWNGTNSSGFSALPGGARYYSGDYFDDLGYGGYWWSSSPSGSDAWYRFLSSGNSDVYRYYGSVRHGFSVRCVRD